MLNYSCILNGTSSACDNTMFASYGSGLSIYSATTSKAGIYNLKIIVSA